MQPQQAFKESIRGKTPADIMRLCICIFDRLITLPEFSPRKNFVTRALYEYFGTAKLLVNNDKLDRESLLFEIHRLVATCLEVVIGVLHDTSLEMLRAMAPSRDYTPNVVNRAQQISTYCTILVTLMKTRQKSLLMKYQEAYDLLEKVIWDELPVGKTGEELIEAAIGDWLGCRERP